MTGLSVWEAVKVFFNRSSTMSQVLHGLNEGERDYLRDFASFLDDLRNRAEVATGLPHGSEEILRQQGDELIQLMRQKRQALNGESVKIRQAADKAILALH
jgi:chlorite dismutase